MKRSSAVSRNAARLLGVLLAVWCSTIAVPAYAQSAPRLWVLANRAYFEPLIADPRAAQIAGLVYGHASEYPFVVKRGQRRIWDISLGKEIPVIGFDSSTKCWAATHAGGKGCWGMGLWLPVSFHMVEDFKDESSPVLDTDYRFSGMFKASASLSDTTFIAARVAFGHESTHLGDEFVIHAQQQYGAAFERVNVSFESWDFGASLEHWLNDTHLVRFRAGMIQLKDNKKGFYDANLLGASTATLTPSVANREPYAGVEWTQDGDAPIHIRDWNLYLSLDARYKTVYGYHRSSPTAPDDRAMSYNFVAGFKNKEQRFNQKGTPELYFRLYHGVNPSGQFRSQKNFTLFGIGVRVPV